MYIYRIEELKVVDAVTRRFRSVKLVFKNSFKDFWPRYTLPCRSFEGGLKVLDAGGKKMNIGTD